MNSAESSNSIVSFYRGEKPDYLGRKLHDLWQWGNGRLEAVLNYIQILFPNREASQFNFSAPLLDQATCDAFLQDESLRQNLATSLDVMLRFYGLEYEAGSGQVVKRGDFAVRAGSWINRYNHNYLRITRILKCLVELGLADRARAFLKCLQTLYSEHQAEIGPETLAYWQNAVAPAATT